MSSQQPPASPSQPLPSSPETDIKIRQVFGTYAVNKRLVNSQEISRLPRFISEYLVAKFSGSDGGDDGLKKLADFVNVHFPELRDKDKILHDIMNTGSYTLMDEFKVETDIKAAKHRLVIPCIGVHDAQILNTVLDENAELLRSGMWGIATLKYLPPSDGDGPARAKEGTAASTPIIMSKFTPFQVTNVSLSNFASQRSRFSRDEWTDLLVTSIGLNPASYTADQKLLLLCRLVPLVEANSNILEIGPKATGKTYLYRNLSYHTRVISGGKVSPATIFYNISTKTAGEIGIRDCVAFDEINWLTFHSGEEMIGKLKDYMVDGFFERGPKKAHSACSLVFMGNIEFNRPRPEPEEVVAALPGFMRDSAILDRIHAFIPGWDLPKIKQSSEHLANGYGIVADYLSEVFHQLSLQSFGHIISERVRLEGSNITIRDEKAIKKTATGLLKVLAPDGRCDSSDIALCVDAAIRGRAAVNSLLHAVSPTEFELKEIGYSVVQPGT